GTLTLALYVASAMKVSNRLRLAQIDVHTQEVQIARRQQRSTSELSVEPSIGGHQYLSSPYHQTQGVMGLGGAWRHQTASGQSMAIEGHSMLPSGSALKDGRLLSGEPRYGLSGNYTLPLLRNRFGRQFGMEVILEGTRKKEAEAAMDATRLSICGDAIARYVERYVAQRKLEVYGAVLKEKRRIWYQTASDYRKKMVPRLDMLAAKSDWIAAQAREPSFMAAVARADAALREFYLAPGALSLAKPTGINASQAHEAQDPRFRALAAREAALQQERAVIVEQNRSDLDLGFSLGIDRFHNAATQLADVTDMWGMLALRYVWPIKRPDVALRLQLLELSAKTIEQERLLLRRQLGSGLRQAKAVEKQARRAEALVEKQLKVSKQQIHAAYRDFRAGKLQFQNFLDHWERYQAARLSLWDARRDRWLAQRNTIIATGHLPALCQQAATP
ncbi:MAG: TolC family protein, partial [Deltaproteobacteria bacterium]|nr:TolC family protein [Deltaproteobacteria bacterium]